jgi:hypothetical protein
MRLGRMGGLVCLVASATLIHCAVKPAYGYALLAHEAIVDRVWEDAIKPLLLRRYPDTTADQLVEAQAYAYGGCIIQDMGYYPFSGRYFSDLTHYVRSGDFVESMIRNASDVDDYAFALGALSHYAADTSGHSIAVNKSVPRIYPNLGKKYGGDVTYEDNPAAHIRTEFSFDVLQVAGGNYASNTYHQFIGFKVAKRLLKRAFLETYGIRLKSIFASLDLALSTYRAGISEVIPQMTRVAWEMKRSPIKRQVIESGEAFTFVKSRADFEQEWGHQYRTPGLFDKTAALMFRILPKSGLFEAMAFRQPSRETERLFLDSMDESRQCYELLLWQVDAGCLKLDDINLDTGRPARRGDYRLGDQAYDRLVREIRKSGLRHMTRELRENIVSFYGRDPFATIAEGRGRRQ